MATVHPAFDKFYDELVLMINNSETFDADMLEPTVWEEHKEKIIASLKGVNRKLTQSKARMKFLTSSLFVAEDSATWINPDRYLDYLSLWDSALAEGFIPEAVCPNGPNPSVDWISLPPTPTKSLGKRFVSPTLAVTAPVSPPLSGPPGLVPTSSLPATLPAQFGGLVHGAAVEALPGLTTELAPNPSNQAVIDALKAFISGGPTTGGGLPSSLNPGTPNALPSSTSLPVLNVVPNPWVAPATQPIYDLNKFHQSYVEVEDKFVLNSDGTISTKKTGRKISTAVEWIAAAQHFGIALSSAPEANQFVWTDFMLWIQHMTVLFGAYQFAAVVEYDRAWRRWRRANLQPWSALNPSLRDLYLTGKGIVAAPVKNVKTASPSGSTPVCHIFSRPSGCNRGAACRFTHRCSRCHTTFPPTSSSCPCVAGILPPGTTLPAGVTFGK